MFVAVPTGLLKEYAVLYMLASLKNLDYPHDKLSVNFAVTNRGNSQDDAFRSRLTNLINHSNFPFETSITWVSPTKTEKERWAQYYAVICNLHELRKKFLDGDAEYFWVLGGDNPPPRHCLKHLLKIDADVSSAMIRQRPNRRQDFSAEGVPTVPDAEPIYFVYLWRIADLQKRKDLDPRVKEQLREAWINLPMIHQLKTDRKLTIFNTSFGSGCSLSKRHVIEHCGYYLTRAAYCSEDLSYMQWVQTLGFDSAINTSLHCGHFDPNGALY